MLSRISARSVRPLGAHPVADFFTFQTRASATVQQHLVPLVAESAASSCARPSCSGTLYLCLHHRDWANLGDITAD
jgi:hypothetical protein